MSGFVPAGVSRYTGLLEVFRIESPMPRLCAGLSFTYQGRTQVWCATCIYEDGQPDESMLDDASPITVAARFTDPMNEATDLVMKEPSEIDAPSLVCDKCEQDLPMVEYGERSIEPDAVAAEIGARERDGDNGLEGDVNDLADSFRERFDDS